MGRDALGAFLEAASQGASSRSLRALGLRDDTNLFLVALSRLLSDDVGGRIDQ